MEKPKTRKRQARGVKYGGRKKGTPNKKTLYMQSLKESGFDPFEIVRMVAAGEVENTEIWNDKITGAPMEKKVPLAWDLRLKAALELCSYIEAKARGHEPVDPYEHDRNVAETGRIAEGLRELEEILDGGKRAASEADADPPDGTGETIN